MDSQSEVVNKVIAMYLRCVTGDRLRAWVDWLPWAEYCYNTSFHTALRATPFEVVYGRPPPPILPYQPGSARTDTADALLRYRDEVLAEVRQRLLQAQQLSKKYYDASHYDLEFAVGEAIGFGYACFIGPRSLWSPGQKGSLALATLGLSKCWSALAGLPIGCSFWPALDCMTSFIWACSSGTRGILRQRLLRYRRC